MSTLRRRRPSGQGLVEFAIALIPFMFILMGIVDLGRGIYVNNGVSQAAREIARVTAVHPGATLGMSSQTQAVLQTQRSMIPGLADPNASVTFTCTTINDMPIAGSGCASSPSSPLVFVKVQVQVPFSVVTPLLGAFAPQSLSSTAHIRVP